MGPLRSLDMLGKGPNAGCKSILRTFISPFIASYEINVQMEDNILQLILAILCEIYRGEEEQNNSVTIGVADEHVCVVLGRGGRNINEIGQGSGARIKISDKVDFMFRTASDRKVTITGSTREIRTAENMIMKKVASVTEGD